MITAYFVIGIIIALVCLVAFARASNRAARTARCRLTWQDPPEQDAPEPTLSARDQEIFDLLNAKAKASGVSYKSGRPSKGVTVCIP